MIARGGTSERSGDVLHLGLTRVVEDYARRIEPHALDSFVVSVSSLPEPLSPAANPRPLLAVDTSECPRSGRGSSGSDLDHDDQGPRSGNQIELVPPHEQVLGNDLKPSRTKPLGNGLLRCSPPGAPWILPFGVGRSKPGLSPQSHFRSALERGAGFSVDRSAIALGLRAGSSTSHALRGIATGRAKHVLLVQGTLAHAVRTHQLRGPEAQIVDQVRASEARWALAIACIFRRPIATTGAIDRISSLAEGELRIDRGGDPDRVIRDVTIRRRLKPLHVDRAFLVSIRTAHPPLEVIDQADPRFTLKRAALDVDFLDAEPAESGRVLILGDAGVANAPRLTTQQQEGKGNQGGSAIQVSDRKFRGHRAHHPSRVSAGSAVLHATRASRAESTRKWCNLGYMSKVLIRLRGSQGNFLSPCQYPSARIDAFRLAPGATFDLESRLHCFRGFRAQTRVVLEFSNEARAGQNSGHRHSDDA